MIAELKHTDVWELFVCGVKVAEGDNGPAAEQVARLINQSFAKRYPEPTVPRSQGLWVCGDME